MGGRIKVRKTETSSFVLIQSEQHLNDVIENIDNSAPAETSTNHLDELPNSPSITQSNSARNPLTNTDTELDNYTNSRRTLSTNARDRQPVRNNNKFAAPSNANHDTNRNHQWQQMRQKQYHLSEQPKSNQRYKQQDRRRQIDLSPNQYRQYNYKPAYNHPQPHCNNSRNYSSHRFEENY